VTCVTCGETMAAHGDRGECVPVAYWGNRFTFSVEGDPAWLWSGR